MRPPTYLILALLSLILSLFTCTSTKFKKSSLEQIKNNYALAAYSLCMRSMSDATSNVAGKNITFCDLWKDYAGKEIEYQSCKNAMGKENKQICYLRIYNRYDQMKEVLSKK